MAGTSRSHFGQLADGTPVDLFTLVNAQGVRARITNYGGTIISLEVPDRHGQLDDVVLGFEALAPYESESPYFGALIGRCCNRVAHGRLPVNGRIFQLSRNDGEHHLHGGNLGFDKVTWQVVSFTDDRTLVLRHQSPNGHDGYPGNLDVRLSYELGDDNSLTTRLTATTDQATHVNLTQHSYFNLGGLAAMRKGANILGHELMIAADKFLPVDPGLIPTGELVPVAESPFDFRQARAIGLGLDEPHPQLLLANGYDHNYILREARASETHLAARVVEPVSGRVLELWTSEPGLQFYSGNFLDGSIRGKGVRYGRHSGFCLEPQHFPDSPNRADFPSTLLEAGGKYASTLSYRFEVC